jgi:DNA-binding MarR family transcriptional regulator
MATAQGSSAPGEQELAVAWLLLARYSGMINEIMERVVATGSNYDIAVLSHLYRHSEQRPHQLMAVTGLSRPSVAAVVARLERLGFLHRSFGESDRRTTLASLTALGRRRMSELGRALEAHFEASRALVTEFLDLLGWVSDDTAVRGADDTALALIGRLAEAGAAYDARVDANVRSLDPRQLRAINILRSVGRSRPKQLAEALHLSSGGLTFVMDQLEAKGIVTRTHGVDDRRAVFIELTAKGMQHSRAMAVALAASAPEICPPLNLSCLADSQNGPRQSRSASAR